MRKLTALIMVSILVSGYSPVFATHTIVADSWCYGDDALTKMGIDPGYYNMFDMVSLTEHQRMHIRDLVSQTCRNRTGIDRINREKMRQLITTDQFDEVAVRELAEKMSMQLVNRQIEMARVRNKIYSLLTQKQKDLLHQKYSQ
ncbi:Spy/CpxP family protein refolding chaperone [Candidatus Fukatsuia symbiotica]|nr:Spy/CpxP family protein refolding chaperone [Candidatus Fukatsuia symbiotica]MEA9443822.1 Spy/CpxP family protein refolding chaperone [Candidatus Fukatsuia symbiotica]